MVQGDRVTTVNGKMEVGTVATQVEVTGTPLLNAVDTTSGYVLATQAINNTPLGTGSFTRLAILSPGLSADFMNTSRSNAGFGNQRYGPTDSAIRAIAPGVEHLVLYLRRRHACAGPCNSFAKSFSVGPSGNFANTGFYQNMLSGSTNLN